MQTSVEFLLGLFDSDETAHVAQENCEGVHGALLQWCQEVGFLSREPGMHPVPSCPHCGEGVPYRLGDRYVCDHCRSTVDRRHLLLWRFDLQAFLEWLAGRLQLRGGVRRIDGCLWQLGTGRLEGSPCECFYQRGGPLSDVGRARLAAFRDVLVLHGLSSPSETSNLHGRCLSLLGVLQFDAALTVTEIGPLLRPRGNVRFDPHSGALWVGDTWLGEVPVGSKEFFFLGSLAHNLDHFVSYEDLKREVLRQAGSTDTTEEATFCQTLKSRIKRKWVPKIDLIVATTNKAEGYRLRGFAELCL